MPRANRDPLWLIGALVLGITHALPGNRKPKAICFDSAKALLGLRRVPPAAENNCEDAKELYFHEFKILLIAMRCMRWRVASEAGQFIRRRQLESGIGLPVPSFDAMSFPFADAELAHSTLRAERDAGARSRAARSIPQAED
jgi:hypothetical protein